jgi:hypothetical protein
MGKGKRLKKLKDKTQNQTEEIKNIIVSGQDLVPLTNELIEKLVSTKAIPRKDLIELQKKGAQYSINRNSFFLPQEWNGLIKFWNNFYCESRQQTCKKTRLCPFLHVCCLLFFYKSLFFHYLQSPK